MASPLSAYINSKTTMRVSCNCPTPHIMEKTQIEFGMGFRCPKATSVKYSFDDVKKIFARAGHTLLAKTYVDASTTLAYECRCGRKDKFAMMSIIKINEGCSQCRERWPFYKAATVFQLQKCKLWTASTHIGDLRFFECTKKVEKDPYNLEFTDLSLRPTDYHEPEYIVSSSYVIYLCKCKEYAATTFKKFKDGTRCSKECEGEKKVLKHHLKGSKSRFSSVAEIKNAYEHHNIKIVSILVDGEKRPFDRVPKGNEKIEWLCSCKRIYSTTLFKTFVAKTEFTCRSCGAKRGKGENCPTYETFCTKLEERGWEMVSPKEDYIDTKSELDVRCNCDPPHDCNTSYNRFNSEHGCKKAAIQAQLGYTIAELAVKFQQKGFTLLSTEYTGNTQKLDYICRCKRECKVTYTNFPRKLHGCKECSGRHTYEEIEDYLKDHDCELYQASIVIKDLGQLPHIRGLNQRQIDSNIDRTKTRPRYITLEDGTKAFRPEQVLNTSYLHYKCSCGNQHCAPWRSFKTGYRCSSCSKKKSFAFKDYVFASGKTVSVQGYENIAIDALIAEGIEEDDILVGDLVPLFNYYFEGDGKNHIYYPDIYVPSKDLIIEVKSMWTFQMHRDLNIAKFEHVLSKGQRMEMRIFDKKGVLVVIATCIEDLPDAE